ncbi:MAG: extensin family protein [Myxococcota bacterium]|nr:extensin family protein [Myxococcota bacterium]
MRGACLLVLLPSTIAFAQPVMRPADDVLTSCTAELDRRGVAWKPAKRAGVAHGVEIIGSLGGVTLSASGQPLVIDCSLAVSLDEAGRYLRELGVEQATFSSAYSRRNVRGTNRPSKHSYGLAIDVHTFNGTNLGTLRVDRDYEQGLGDDVDCVGRPLTQGGAVMKILQCQLARSGLFHLVLSPDFDDAHHDHFHLEVKPWSQRTGLRAPVPAIH